MKSIIVFLISSFVLINNLFANSGVSTEIIKKNTFKKLSLSLDLTTELYQDRDTRDVIGTNNFLAADVGYKIDSKSKLVLMNSFTGKFQEEKDSSITYDLVQLEYKRKLAKYSESGVDLKFDGRASYTTNAEQRKSYGTYGLAQARLYYGLPLFGKFSINKYISYIRLEKYIIKDDASSARDFGWRTRIAPSYTPIKGLDFSVSFTYSGYKINDSSIDEEVRFSPGVRYQYKKLALIVSAEFKPYDTKDNSFKFIDGFEKTPKYSTNLAFYAF